LHCSGEDKRGGKEDLGDLLKSPFTAYIQREGEEKGEKRGGERERERVGISWTGVSLDLQIDRD
jgi:hypothetical protein